MEEAGNRSGKLSEEEVREAAQPQLRLMAEVEVARLGEERTEAAKIMVERRRARPERKSTTTQVTISFTPSFRGNI